LFILFSLGCGDGTCSDESDSRVFLSVNDEEQALLDGHANRDEAVLVFGVLVVGKGGAEGVVEDGGSFIEGDAVLFEVGGGFGWVELEAWHGTSLWCGSRQTM
jgi:hypothetical protein